MNGNETWGDAFKWVLSGMGLLSNEVIVVDHKKSPQINAFGNWVSKMILITVITFIGGGIFIGITYSLWGIVFAIVGVLMWWYGDTELPPDPRTAGMLTCWDQPIMRNVTLVNEAGNKTTEKIAYVVGGRTILAPYFPFFIDVVEFDITNVDKKFEMTVLSGGINPLTEKPLNPIQLTGHVSLTLRANVNDAVDYIQSGKMVKIFEQLDDIIYEQTKMLARAHDPRTIAEKSEVISEPLRKHLKDDVFEKKSFGVEVIKIQARFDLPKEIIAALTASGAEMYQRDGEFQEYDTDTMAAKALQDKYKSDPLMNGRVPGLDQCLKTIQNLRLIRENRVARIETDGNVSGIIIRDVNMNMGGS